jgi:hypothetical protein
VTTWARIEARSYEDALQLLEQLMDLPSTLVQVGEQEWSIYVAADGPDVPEIIYGCGVAASRVSFVEGADALSGNVDAASAERVRRDN